MSVIKYPDGRMMEVKKHSSTVDRRKTINKTEEEKIRDSYIKSNMGMTFEKEVSTSCDFYRSKGVADIYKRPTPIRIVKMSKKKPGMIEEAYFEAKSTTDYVGIYKGKYIDFECKETIHDTVPYHMIREQQYEHLRYIISLGGIGFFLVSFKSYNEVYLIRADIILKETDEKKHPGFKREFFKEYGVEVKRSYLPPYQIIEAIDSAFINELK